MLTFQEALSKCLLQPSNADSVKRDPEKLKALKNALCEARIKRMQMIIKNNQEAMENYARDPSYTRKNIWYTKDLLKASRECNEGDVENFIRDLDLQILGFLSPNFFDTKEEKDLSKNLLNIKQIPRTFIAKENVLASDALDAVFNSVNHPSMIDCGNACRIAEYGALLDVLGKDAFNRIFNNTVGNRMNLSYQCEEEQPIYYFVKPTKFASKFTQDLAFKMRNFQLKNKKKPDDHEIKQLMDTLEKGKIGYRPIKKGHLVPIKGVENYHQKYYFGAWGNINVFCIDDTPGGQKFIGLGLNPEGETEAEIGRKLLKNFNKVEDPLFSAPDHYFVLSPKEKRWDQMKEEERDIAKTVFSKTFPPAKSVEGCQPQESETFKVKLVYDLMQLPLEKVSMEFVKAHPENNSLLNKFMEAKTQKRI